MKQSLQGYERSNGEVGIRNHVLIVPSVICSHHVADRIAARLPYARATPHDHGCAQLGADNEQTARTLVGIGTNPNVAGVVVVGLGCEEVQSTEVASSLSERGVPVREVSIQNVGSTEACVEQGVELAQELWTQADIRKKSVSLRRLTVGVIASDLRESTREVAAPLVGDVISELTEMDIRIVAAGNEPLVVHPEAARTLTVPDAQSDLEALLSRHRDKPPRATHVGMRAAAGNFDEITREWGSGDIEEVLEYGSAASHDSGVGIVDSPSRFEEAATGLIAAGANLLVHLTADGIPAGHPIAPVIKVSGERSTVTALAEDIDIDATAATKNDLLTRIRNVGNGNPCAADKHGLTEFAITRVGPSM
ncbi:altronate dehydratase large subunit [Haladaptatus litoreus]|uniref:Altronate dehydratase large subunit n=1 Tax=Haladaptatus litoreus TaxID=553468 RepID=A0A1N7DHM9_9EURY|nr:UxaA family hydrolase [Haladaptatus litoreus]SIR75308.1 altronate dehydratase large subunit [Haladaptatus litoreus]